MVTPMGEVVGGHNEGEGRSKDEDGRHDKNENDLIEVAVFFELSVQPGESPMQ